MGLGDELKGYGDRLQIATPAERLPILVEMEADLATYQVEWEKTRENVTSVGVREMSWYMDTLRNMRALINRYSTA